VTPADRYDPWRELRRFTDARIALGRAGGSLPTAALLEFGLAHARAKDALHLPFDAQALKGELIAAGFPALTVHSAAADRATYLCRPDLGRRLDPAGRELLLHFRQASRPEIAFVVADGLCSPAVAAHALPVLRETVARLPGWRLAPVVIAEQSRVALGDEIGELLQAELVVMLIGERPGLSSPDSMGIYLTYGPRVGCSDAQRNCISNVRPQGLDYARAAHRLVYLLTAARGLKLSGVNLKDESELLLTS
jgi:ethanolamine ammonia-lyase small subunit